MPAPRLLNSSEIADLRARQFDLDARVLAHERIVAGGTWDSTAMATWDLPIPTRGFPVRNDAHFGDVLVAPDIDGKLFYNGWLAHGDSRIEEVDKPAFDSPSGNTLQQMLEDLTKGVAGIGVLVLLGFIAFRLAEKHGYV